MFRVRAMWVVVAIVFVSVFATNVRVEAKDVRRVGVQNACGRDAAALSLTFSDQSGKVVIAGPPAVFPNRGSCGGPKIEITRSNVARVSWGDACVQPNAAVWLLAVSSKSPLTFATGAWLGASGDTLGIITSADVQVTAPERVIMFPRPATFTLIGSLVLNGVMMWLMTRKKPRAPVA